MRPSMGKLLFYSRGLKISPLYDSASIHTAPARTKEFPSPPPAATLLLVRRVDVLEREELVTELSNGRDFCGPRRYCFK